MSSDRDALFAAILANPDEDTPRLVFADWLDEHDEAEYARFIRKQVELARLPPWDEGRLRAECLDRSVVNGDEWYGTKVYHLPLPKGATWSGGPFRRGFPAALEVRDVASFAENAEAFFRAAPIEELNVWGNSSTNEPLDVKPLTDSPFLSRIHRLEFSLANLGKRELDLLQKSPHTAGLRDLTVETSLAPETPPATLFRAPLINRLERLSLHVLADHTSDTLTAIQKAPGPYRLRSLRITSCSNHDEPALLRNPRFFKAAMFENLTELDLSHNQLTANVVERLLGAPCVKQLESLRMNWTRMGPEATPLVKSSKLAELRMLDLSQNDMSYKEIQALAKNPHLVNLRILNLEKNGVGDEGAVALANSPHLKNLLVLRLMDCQIGDAGAQALLDSPLADTLIHLHLYSIGKTISPAMKRKLRKRFGKRVTV